MHHLRQACTWRNRRSTQSAPIMEARGKHLAPHPCDTGTAALPLQSVAAPLFPYSRQGADDGGRRVGEPRQHQAHNQGRVVQVPVTHGGGRKAGKSRTSLTGRAKRCTARRTRGRRQQCELHHAAGGCRADLARRPTASPALVPARGRGHRALGAANTSASRALQLQKIRPDPRQLCTLSSAAVHDIASWDIAVSHVPMPWCDKHALRALDGGQKWHWLTIQCSGPPGRFAGLHPRRALLLVRGLLRCQRTLPPHSPCRPAPPATR